MQDINLNEDSRDVAIIKATLTAAAQYASTKHTIPVDTVLSGMSIGNHLKPHIMTSVQAWGDRQLQAQQAVKPAPAPAPAPAPEQKQKVPAPVQIPPPPAPIQPPALDPTHPAYAIMAARNTVSAFKPEAIPSAFVPDPPVEPQPAEEPLLTEAPAPKKRGRPKKAS